MVVNFMACGISRGACKLARTSMLIKKNSSKEESIFLSLSRILNNFKLALIRKLFLQKLVLCPFPT